MEDMTPQELGEIYDFAIQLGKDAGQMLMDFAKARWRDTGSGGGEQLFLEKDNAVDIVTKADEGNILFHFLLGLLLRCLVFG